MSDMFEYAVRSKLRFPSTRGELTVEQLWEVPLRSKDDFNLDSVAKAANKALMAAEESFVETKKTATQARLKTAFDIVQYVIKTKLADEEVANKRAENKKELEILLKIAAEKKEDKLSEMTERELQKRIAALRADE